MGHDSTNPCRFCSKYVASQKHVPYIWVLQISETSMISGGFADVCIVFMNGMPGCLMQCSFAAFCILLFWTLLVWMAVAQAHKTVINKNRDKHGNFRCSGIIDDGAWKWHYSHLMAAMRYFVVVAKSNQAGSGRSKPAKQARQDSEFPNASQLLGKCGKIRRWYRYRL